MRKFSDIALNSKIRIISQADDGIAGFVRLKGGKEAAFVCSDGLGWDHVSVSFRDRCPTWDEMCQVKDVFFEPNEACMQLHPAEENHISIHPYCLHIWKPQNQEIPLPPLYMV